MRVTTIRFDDQQKPHQVELLFPLDEAAAVAEQAAVLADSDDDPMGQLAKALRGGLQVLRDCPNNHAAPADDHDHDHVPLTLGIRFAAQVFEVVADTRPGYRAYDVLSPLYGCLTDMVFRPYFGGNYHTLLAEPAVDPS